MNESQKKAFWSKVDIKKPMECWNWKRAKKPKGYGNVRVGKKDMIAHRLAFELANNLKIPRGLVACHICDSPSCCNPDHIMLGTIRSNAADMILKHRGKSKETACKGEVNGNSKLTEKKVKEIRLLYSRYKKNQYELASIYNVSQATIGNIVRKRTWRHI